MRAVLSVVALLMLSGCMVEKDPDAVAQEVERAIDAASKTPSTAPANNAPVLGNTSAVANGLTVLVSIAATDLDGDALTWTLSFGDNSSANGTLAPAANATGNTTARSLAGNATHDYAAPGTYNLTLAVTDGKATANRTLNVTVADLAAPAQDPIHIEGSVSCLPTIVLGGGVSDDEQVFAVLAGQRTMTVTLTYAEDYGVEDIDLVATSPGGKDTTSEEAGPEPPMVIDAPEAGDWTLTAIAYSCMGSLDYTFDIAFA